MSDGSSNAGPSNAGPDSNDSNEVDNFGLFPLQESITQSNFKATIVAVHGIDGHYTHTWTNTDVSPHFFWLKDGLGVDLPDCFVLSYGYDSSTMFSSRKTHLSFQDHAAELRHLLERLLETEVRAHPIIFLAHGVGGNLVKEVLVQSSNSVSSIIQERTAVILFFGTPHRSSGLARLGTNSKMSPVGELYKNSAALQSTNESWMHLHRTYSVYSFYETYASQFGEKKALVIPLVFVLENKEGPRVGPRVMLLLTDVKVVTKGEATLNMDHERIIALNASHDGMVMPSGFRSDTYQSVLQSLREIVTHLPKPTAARPPYARPPPPGEISLTSPERIGFRGYVHQFKQGLLSKTAECCLSDMLSKSPTTLLSNVDERSIEEDLNQLIWVHVPLNNTAWINPCLQNIVGDKHAEQRLLIMDQRFWLSHERKRQNIPHSRHFEPSCFVSGNTQTTQFVIYLPYLHWDSTDCFMRRAQYSNSLKRRSPIDIPEILSQEGKAMYKVMRDDSRKSSSLHPRRSLDQFFYSSLPETSDRDQDQAISKNTPKGARGGSKMIMVDQLWLWLIETREISPDTPDRIKTSVLTSFLRKEREAGDVERDLDDIADLHQSIIDEANSMGSEWATNECYLVRFIIEQAVSVMLRVRTEESLDCLGIFRAAIGQATDLQANFFRIFQEIMKFTVDDASASKNGSRNFQKKTEYDSESTTESLIKRDEVKLALDLTDIIDELNSINRVFEAQKDALDKAVRIFDKLDWGGSLQGRYKLLKEKLSTIITQDVESYMKQVKQMTADAQRTKDSLKDLLDLQQKEESLKEAHYSNRQAEAAREQADATEAQSQILLLFTIVTIFFAPLSFFTSYYGMNVREFTGDAGNTNQRAVWKVVGPISAAIIFGLLGGAWYMYERTKRKQLARKAEQKAQDEKRQGVSKVGKSA